MRSVINIAVIEDNTLFAEGLRALVGGIEGLRLVKVVPSVEELLSANGEPIDIVLLDPTLRAQPDAAHNVRRLIAAGHRVLVVDGSRDLSAVAPALAAGAHGYLTRDHDLQGLAATVRAIAFGGTAWTLGPTRAVHAPEVAEAAGASTGADASDRPCRPALSKQEHLVLMTYASGMTLDSAARRLGISPATAHTYLRRVKAKYLREGVLLSTKLELADQVRADCVAGTCPLAGKRA